MNDLVEQPAKTVEEPVVDYSPYAYVMFFFVLGLAIGGLARFSRRVGFCGPRKRFCGEYYIKFVQEEDAISISERIKVRKLAWRANQSGSAGSLPIQQSEQENESKPRSSSKTDDHHQAFGNEDELEPENGPENKLEESENEL